MTHGKWIGAAVFAMTAAAGMTLGAPSSAQARDEGPRVQAHERHGGHPVARAYPRSEARGEFRGHEELHGHGEFGEHHHHYGLGLGFYWAPYWTGNALWGPWGEYWGPSYPENGPSLSQALIEGYGAVDMEVRPGRAEVWVDGRYVAEARDLDGSPSYLWLTAGNHEVEIYRDGYVTFVGEVEVRPGAITEMRVDLVRGFSEPPDE
jgi:hypothetical protein